MRCSTNWKVLVSAYADGELDAAQAAQVRAHLGQCQTCRELLQQWGANQSLFTWAYSQQIDEEHAMSVKESPKVSSKMPEMKPRKSVTKAEVVRRSLVWAAVLVLFILLGQLAVWSRLPSMGGEGSSVVTSSQIQKTRLVWGVTLNIGPNSQVMRTGPRSIKLIKGWVEASVTGRPIQISTKRVSITDMGTRFEVGSGPQLDYVKVSKGWVWVVAGPKSRKVKLGVDDVLLVDNKQTPVVNNIARPLSSGPSPRRVDINETINSADQLMWQRCVRQLHDKYPGIVLSSSRSYGRYLSADKVVLCGISMVAGLEQTVDAHYIDIMRSLCGGGTESSRWRIPTALIMVSGLQPLGGGVKVCLLELVMNNGNLVWQISDTEGHSVSLVANLITTHGDNQLYDGTDLQLPNSARWYFGPSRYGTSAIYRHIGQKVYTISNLPDWPMYIKPTIALTLRAVPLAQLYPQEAKVKSDVATLIARMNEVSLGEDAGLINYVNTQQTDYFGIYWNQQLDMQMKNRSNSDDVVVGVFTCTKPLLQPKLPAGTYTVHMKRTGLAPRKLYLAAAGSNTAEPQSAMLDVKADDERGNTYCSLMGSTYVSRGYIEQNKQIAVWMSVAPESKQKPRPSLAEGTVIIDNR
ncbi:MAG: zf-HC2 domain-containing protein [Armatimonadota bacterium]